MIQDEDANVKVALPRERRRRRPRRAGSTDKEKLGGDGKAGSLANKVLGVQKQFEAILLEGTAIEASQR